MPSTTVELRNIAGTEAAVGWAGAHTVVVDRPEGKAGGRGLGFNGAQLLALTIGGCFCNDLRYVAHATGVELGAFRSRSPLSSKAIRYSQPRQLWSSRVRRSMVLALRASSKRRRRPAWRPTRCVADYPWRFGRSVRVLAA